MLRNYLSRKNQIRNHLLGDVLLRNDLLRNVYNRQRITRTSRERDFEYGLSWQEENMGVTGAIRETILKRGRNAETFTPRRRGYIDPSIAALIPAGLSL